MAEFVEIQRRMARVLLPTGVDGLHF